MSPSSAVLAVLPGPASCTERRSSAVLRRRAGARTWIKTAVAAVPVAVHGTALLAAAGVASRLGWLAAPVAVLAYAVTAVLVAGAVGRATRRHVQPGRFDRDLTSAPYRGRFLYGAAWTSLVYCRPLFHFVLACPPLGALALRLFGYRGSLDVTLYPDTWIRDLPLLAIGRGVYVSNRATLGTNIVRGDGQILVDRITIGDGSLVGHLCTIGPGASLGKRTEIGVGAGLGLKVRLGDDVFVGPRSIVDHGTRLGDGVHVGTGSYVGKRCTIASGIRLPARSVVPDRTRLTSQAEADGLLGRRPTSPLA